MPSTVLLAFIVFNIVFAGLCGYIGFMKGYPFVLGAALGLVLGCIGLLIIALIPRRSPVPELAIRPVPRLYRAGDAPVVSSTGAQATATGWVDPRSQPAVVREAGWYDDPYGMYRFRYWDGNDWTDHTSNGS